MMDFTTMLVEGRLLIGAAEAYGSPLVHRPVPSCSVCSTTCPAGEHDECDRQDCPLEGRRPS